MQGPTALILAGAGMLNDVARALVYDGWQVILPARRYVPVPIDRGEPPGRAVWLEAHWDQPEELAQRVAAALRSEEHTSELQSRENLVCRLLLEKKKRKMKNAREST